jgi:hypothetical protein
MAIDFSSDVGRVRLRTADISDIPYLPDSVYQQAITDCNGNLPQAAKQCATYILGLLSFKDHRKLAQLEVFGNSFQQYKEFLILTVKDPSFMEIAPVPYNTFGTDLHPLIQFSQDWNNNFAMGTQSAQLAWDALGAPNNDTGNWQWNS